MRKLPIHAAVGLVIMLVSETGMLTRVEPFWSWHTPICWTGYILFADGVVLMLHGSSWLSAAPAEFAFLAVVSIPLWLVFEFFNLFIRNWHYINLPGNLAWRTLGYAWSFATIWPAIFETADLIGTLRKGQSPLPLRCAPRARAAGSDPAVTGWSGAGMISMLAGAAVLAWPLAWPSPYLAAPVWLGFIFLLDPLNARLGAEALTRDWREGRADRAINLMLAGLTCGLLWEFWNYWARTKWVYSVPILERFKVFEMPLPGYLGFPAFALECFTMYVIVRRAVWRRPPRPIAL
jgi:hypothetical protein